MTYESAFSSMTGEGTTNAMKRPSWKGYIYRTDLPLNSTTCPAYSSSATYSVGDKVSVTTGSGSSAVTSYYVCKTAVTSEETFDSSKWYELTSRSGYTVTYKEATDDTGSGSIVPGTDYVTEYVATFSPYVSGTYLEYTCTAAPQGVYGGSTKYLEIDAQLQNALLASDWITGKKDDYETARAGGSGRW